MMEIEKTIEFIKKAHEGQVDKAGLPYYTHPIRVMNLLPEDASLEEKLVALLHDVIEDTHLEAHDLYEAGYSETIINAVRIITRYDDTKHLTYQEWIDFIISTGNTIAMRVKLADNLDNMSEDRIDKLPNEELKERVRSMIINRYSKSSTKLKKALNL